MIKLIMIKIMMDYAFTFMHTPYVWGGNNIHQGLDCSGFVLEVMRSIIPNEFNKDMTAQMIYNKLVDDEKEEGLEEGSILFFGESIYKIKHVGIALNDKTFIESGGGGRWTTKRVARKKGYGVRIRPIRSDLVAAIKLFKGDIE